jgi:plasmid maintenance system killer protein
MDISASDNKLRSALEDETVCKRQYGSDMTKKIMLRLSALRAAESLADFWPPNSGPERCHELKGDRIGKFSVDLKQTYRLLFKPSGTTSASDRSDELQRWKSIMSIEILAIEDTHG